MHASIHSQDHDNFPSSGKKYRVLASKFDVTCAEGSIFLSAAERESYIPRYDSAVTPIRDTERTFRLRLSPSELKRIVDATAAKLLTFAVEVQK